MGESPHPCCMPLWLLQPCLHLACCLPWPEILLSPGHTSLMLCAAASPPPWQTPQFLLHTPPCSPPPEVDFATAESTQLVSPSPLADRWDMQIQSGWKRGFPAGAALHRTPCCLTRLPPCCTTVRSSTPVLVLLLTYSTPCTQHNTTLWTQYPLLTAGCWGCAQPCTLEGDLQVVSTSTVAHQLCLCGVLPADPSRHC
jgi:hypothetical protein